jgi:hypothetical protein
MVRTRYQLATYLPLALAMVPMVLVRVQAHMLARIVVEIRAADIAVKLEPYRDVFYADNAHYHGMAIARFPVVPAQECLYFACISSCL